MMKENKILSFKYQKLLGSLLVLGFIGFVSYVGYTHYQAPRGLDRTILAASLSGFKPDTQVEYTVFASEAENRTGKAVVSQEGTVEIPVYQTTGKLGKESALTYNMRIDDAENPLMVNFQIDPVNGTVSASGRGVNVFSDIAFEVENDQAPVGRLQTKADWAGVFAQDSEAVLSNGFTSDSAYRLVLYNNIENDAQAQNPYIIKVQSLSSNEVIESALFAVVAIQDAVMEVRFLLNYRRRGSSEALEDIEVIEGDVDDVQDMIADLQDRTREVEALRSRRSERLALLETLDSIEDAEAIEDLEAAIEALDAAIEALDAAIADLQDMIETAIANLENRVAELQSTLSGSPSRRRRGGRGRAEENIRETRQNITEQLSDIGGQQASISGSGSIEDTYIAALQEMTRQFTAVMMQQALIIGSFFDAKHQLETQRELQALQAEAVKDYHPSEQMCQFGSFVKSVAASEEKSALDKLAINNILMANYTNKEHGSTSEGAVTDISSRIRQFRMVYCDPQDNNDGLAYMCDHEQDQDPSSGGLGAADPARMNIDIDFARAVGSPMTLSVDFTDADKSDSEEDVIALARNLYWPVPLTNANAKRLPASPSKYLNARTLMAMQNVAHNSFAEIVSLKSEAVPTAPTAANQSGSAFMKALLKEFGLTDDETHQALGDNPSYYAQMEMLTKKIYQSPDFYTNLYDKPANVDRVEASLEAIQLMQARDHYEARLRQEMLTSLMVEEALAKHVDTIEGLMRSEASRL